MCVAGILLGVFVMSVTAAYMKLKSMRSADIAAAVLWFLMKSGIIYVFEKLDLMKRPALIEETCSNGLKLLRAEFFYCTTEEVLSLKIRESDVFVATYPKAGTTWMQEITWLICNNADVQAAKKASVGVRCPYMEMIDSPNEFARGLQCLEAWPITKQRIMKTHLPFEFLPREVQDGAKCKIIYVARNPKDLCTSRFHFHRASQLTTWPGTWNEFFANFCEGKLENGSWFEHNLKYWEKRQSDKERIYFVTYEALKKDLRGEIKALSQFLEKNLTEEQLDVISEHCSFGSMSKNSMANYANAPAIDKIFKFMRKGQVGDWKNQFTINQNSSFDELYKTKMEGSKLCFEFEPEISST